MSQGKSEVFFAPARKSKSSGMYNKLAKILTKMDIRARVQPGDIVAIKQHFGELGNTAYLRPVYARKLVELVLDAGGQPFLTDTTTLYRHARHSLFSYLETARRNGYTAETMGCPVLIADGFKNSGVFVDIPNPVKVPKIKVAQLVYEADFLISLAHVTFHPDMTPAAGIKNVAMGCVTKESKLHMHNSIHKPKIDSKRCEGCGRCVRICPGGALAIEAGAVAFDGDKCVGCADCIAVCPSGAIDVPWGAAVDTQRGIVDGFRGVASTFKPGKSAFINIAEDITEYCDCIENNGLPMIPDIGIIGSFDPLAADKAAYDMIVGSLPYPGSIMDTDESRKSPPGKKIRHRTLDMDEFFTLCSKTGIGNLDYTFTEID